VRDSTERLNITNQLYETVPCFMAYYRESFELVQNDSFRRLGTVHKNNWDKKKCKNSFGKVIQGNYILEI